MYVVRHKDFNYNIYKIFIKNFNSTVRRNTTSLFLSTY